MDAERGGMKGLPPVRLFTQWQWRGSRMNYKTTIDPGMMITSQRTVRVKTSTDTVSFLQRTTTTNMSQFHKFLIANTFETTS